MGIRSARWAGFAGLLVGVLAAMAVVAILLVPRPSHPSEEESAPPLDDDRFAAAVALPSQATEPVRPGVSGTVDSDWVDRVAEATGIPARALAAYAGAALNKNAGMPECGLGWTTLAAIGAVESDHGRHGGSMVEEDGTVSPPIVGVPLAGEGTAHIPDSDGGEWDGDTDWDRAIGPMQLIPQTWRNWHVDGSGDGLMDPQNIDDASVATSNYLCRASSPMIGEEGWRAGVIAFNSSVEYVDQVARTANRYARLAEPALTG